MIKYWCKNESPSCKALPPLEDEDLPVAKRPRRPAPTISTEADGVVHQAHTADTKTTDSADDTPTYPVSPAASLPSATILVHLVAIGHWKKTQT
jgi:hypothetical protein